MWGALLGSLISGAFSYFGGQEQASAQQDQDWLRIMMMSKAGKNLQKAYDGVIADIASNPTGYAGSKVQAAMYEPVDITESQRSSVQGNLDNLGLINQLVSGANRATTANDIERILSFDPNAMQTLGNLSENAAMWSSGRLPTDAIEDIISSRSSSSGAYGTPGGAGAATLRDLGLNSMDAVNKGASLFSQITNAAESISPVSRQIAAPQFFITPQQGLQTDLQQALLDQQSRQNANNLNAAPDPALALQMQLRLQAANSRAAMTSGNASLVGNNTVPYASMYGQIGNSLGNAIAGLFGGGQQSYGGMGGGFSSGFGSSPTYNPAAYNAYAMQYNSNLTGDTAPKAYAVY